jgi:hypothetical protein
MRPSSLRSCAKPRAGARLSWIGGALLGLASACVQATQTYALAHHPEAPPSMVGSLSVERIEGGQRLVVLQLDRLPPPERIAPGLREFVVWLEDPRGREVKVGKLHYDREHQSGNLLATTELSAFTVRVTGERDDQGGRPSGVLLAERRVVTN